MENNNEKDENDSSPLKRIDKFYIYNEIRSLLKLEKGLLFTIINLFIRPGKMPITRVKFSKMSDFQHFNQQLIANMELSKITVDAIINADINKVWDYYTSQEHITLEFCGSKLALSFRKQGHASWWYV